MQRNRFARRVFQFFLLLLALSIGILFVGQWYGDTLSEAGHTASMKPREIVIGNNVLTFPENMIRFKAARQDGVRQRLDVYMVWPELEGYSPDRSDDFNHVDGSRRILFVTFEEQMMSRDMSNRLEPVYRQVIEAHSVGGPESIRFHRFKQGSGYEGEVLAVSASEPGEEPFVARCLTGTAAREALAPCERDINLGNRLSMTYRFPASLLGQWRLLDKDIRQKVAEHIKTPL